MSKGLTKSKRKTLRELPIGAVISFRKAGPERWLGQLAAPEGVVTTDANSYSGALNELMAKRRKMSRTAPKPAEVAP